MPTPTKANLAKLNDKQLVVVLDRINDILWDRHEPDEYEIEGLETLTSAVAECESALDGTKLVKDV